MEDFTTTKVFKNPETSTGLHISRISMTSRVPVASMVLVDFRILNIWRFLTTLTVRRLTRL